MWLEFPKIELRNHRLTSRHRLFWRLAFSTEEAPGMHTVQAGGFQRDGKGGWRVRWGDVTLNREHQEWKASVVLQPIPFLPISLPSQGKSKAVSPCKRSGLRSWEAIGMLGARNLEADGPTLRPSLYHSLALWPWTMNSSQPPCLHRQNLVQIKSVNTFLSGRD